MSEKDTQIDMTLDLRDFYQNHTEEDEDDSYNNHQPNDNYSSYSKGKKGGYKNKPVFMPKEPKEELFLENIKLIKYKSIKNM